MKGHTRTRLVILGLLILLPVVGGARLAIAPVFLYWPGPEWGKPLYVQPHEGAHLLFGGPYYQLQAGKYRAAFRVRNGPTEATVPLASLRLVMYNNLSTAVLRRDVFGNTGSGNYHEEEIAFTLPVPSVVETQASYTGVAPLWIDGVRIWPDPRGLASLPLAGILMASAGGIILVFAVAYWKRQRGYLAALVLARICFAISAAVLVIRAERAGSLPPLDGSWLLPPSVWIVALLLGGGLILWLVQRLNGARDPFFGIADALSDGTIIAVLIWNLLQLNFFSLAAVAVAAWMCKLALMVFALARGRRDRALWAAITVSGYAFVGLLPLYHHYSTSGDQTSYLVETLSLIRHKRINTWEVLESGEYREFAPSADKRSLEIDTITLGRVSGYPARDLGISIFALPGYLLAKVDGARLGMELVAVTLSGVIFVLVCKLGVRWDACVLAWAATCFSFPILHFSSMLYPELLGATLTATGLFLLDRPLTRRCALLMGMCIGVLPAMNARYWTLAASLAILCLARLGEAKRWTLLPFVAVLPLVVVATEVWVDRAVYGVSLPNAGYFLVLHGASPAIYSQSTPFAPDFLRGWVGLWLDRYWGVFVGAPVFLLALAGVPALWLRSRRLAIRILVLFAPYFVAVASTTFWQGGPSALPRFLVPVLPLFALPLAAILDNRFRILAGALTAVGALTAMASLSSFDTAHTALRLATRCADSFGFAVASYLPSLAKSVNYRGSVALIVPWAGAGLLMAVLGWKSQVSKTPQASKPETIRPNPETTRTKGRRAMTTAGVLCIGVCVCLVIAYRASKPPAAELSRTGVLDQPLTSFRENLTSTTTRLDLHPGQEIKIPVRIENPGPETWVSGGRLPVMISYKWYKDADMLSIEGERTSLPGPIKPKQSVNVDVRVVAPLQPGDFTVRISLVQEAVAWFMTRSNMFLQLTASVK